MRKDALENRERLLEAADAMFRERGCDVSVAEIAAAAGIGRGTLFRNFRNKDELIAAVVAARLNEALAAGRDLLEHDPDDAEVTFTVVADLAARQEANRALLQVVDDEYVMALPALRNTQATLLELFEALLDRGKRAGAIRPEATATDLLILIKGLCMHAPVEALAPEAILRHVDLVRAALTTPSYSRPLRGESASLPV